MLNKSAIFKAAHANAKYDRETWPKQHQEPYRVTFARCLRHAWQDAILERDCPTAPKSAELIALEAEHYRRDLSCSHYFGSADYRNNQQRIKQLKRAA